MKNNVKPCGSCGKKGCDYRHCEPYKSWLCDSWSEFSRYRALKLWPCKERSGEMLYYVHPDVIRRYLHDGPCAECGYRHCCDVPCGKYLHWWDARMAWLRWHLTAKA